jgi:hypothetical protein
MKNFLLILIILFCSNLFGQNDSIIKLQKEYFKEAEKLVNDSNGLDALFYYHQVCFPDLKTTIEFKAKKKIDSLLPIYQKKESTKWIGEWKLKQLKSNLFSYEKIIISETEISFYNKIDDRNPSRTELIKHTEYDQSDFTINLNSVEFNNKEIWEFSVEKKEEELRLFPNLKTEADGTTYILLDERAMIINKEDREKALAEEIRTYYIKIK